MKLLKRVERKFSEDHIVSITCDVCKKTFVGAGWGRSSSYEVIETTVTLKTGTHYPEIGSGEITSFDICPSCFENVLIPFMKTHGAEPTIEEWAIG